MVVRPVHYLKCAAVVFILTVVLTIVCGRPPADNPFSGTWRAVLESPGGELPFIMRIAESPQGGLTAHVVNGAEKAAFTSVLVDTGTIHLVFDHYDSEIRAGLNERGDRIDGLWSKRILSGNRMTMKFMAEKGDSVRFPVHSDTEKDSNPDTDITGNWTARFTDADGATPALGIFEQSGTHVAGTFLTPTGDYRYLDGVLAHDSLRLSSFDGARALLFTGEMNSGNLLKGDFWSGDSYHAVWTAQREQSDPLPDPYTATVMRDETSTFPFEFPDTEGNTVSSSDPRFKNKVLLAVIYGSWCPNCNDEAPFLVELYEKYHEKGLEIVGLANEYTGDFQKDAEMVKRFVKRYGITWPQLIVGLADKKQAEAALRQLDALIAYPTTVFIGRNGMVQKIHTGFSGPATGVHYTSLKSEFQATIESLLSSREQKP